uniref:Leucine rich repeat containing 74B n=1 Tax=Macaca mulatta TaxID=9544 RepID=A0A5F8AQZ3_MACMU
LGTQGPSASLKCLLLLPDLTGFALPSPSSKPACISTGASAICTFLCLLPTVHAQARQEFLSPELSPLSLIVRKTGETLGPALAENTGLTELNVSWNHLRGPGAVAFARGLEANIFLKVLDISYNGFGDPGASAVGEALKANNVLEELNMSNNRISAMGALSLGLGLRVNQTLRILVVSASLMTETPAQTCPVPVHTDPSPAAPTQGQWAGAHRLARSLATHPASGVWPSSSPLPPSQLLSRIFLLPFLLCGLGCCSDEGGWAPLVSPSSSPLPFLWSCWDPGPTQVLRWPLLRPT